MYRYYAIKIKMWRAPVHPTPTLFNDQYQSHLLESGFKIDHTLCFITDIHLYIYGKISLNLSTYFPNTPRTLKSSFAAAWFGIGTTFMCYDGQVCNLRIFRYGFRQVKSSKFNLYSRYMYVWAY